MAEDKLIKEKKTKEVNENIYALNLDFDNDTQEEKIDIKMANPEVTTVEEDNEIIILKGYEDDDEEPYGEFDFSDDEDLFDFDFE